MRLTRLISIVGVPSQPGLCSMEDWVNFAGDKWAEGLIAKAHRLIHSQPCAVSLEEQHAMEKAIYTQVFTEAGARGLKRTRWVKKIQESKTKDMSRLINRAQTIAHLAQLQADLADEMEECKEELAELI